MTVFHYVLHFIYTIFSFLFYRIFCTVVYRKRNIYRPQRSWAKVIFSQVSVCPQGGVYLSACWDIPPQEQTPPLGPDPPGPDPPWDQTPPGADTPRKTDFSIRSTSGRYASYWNALLFIIELKKSL